jgi:hypothetical protein
VILAQTFTALYWEEAMRSPLLGYNHNVKYGGRVFHVQTEDSGPVNPHIFTHLFFEGSILASMREGYQPDCAEDKVRILMQTQHKSILKQLKRGAYDERIVTFFASRGEVFPAADEAAPIDTVAAMEAEPTNPGVSVETAGAMRESAESAPFSVQPPAEVLDLDSLPKSPAEPGPTPEPLPRPVINPSAPGSYTLRRPEPDRIVPSDPASPRPRPPTRPVATRPSTPVVVQRQVVVGSGPPHAPPVPQRKPTTPVRRRPVTGGPYVVKEGSHVSVGNPPPHPVSAPPPLPMAPIEPPHEPPRTATTAAAAPAPVPATPVLDTGSAPPDSAPVATFVSEQSLDEVILAYLSQGERKRQT